MTFIYALKEPDTGEIRYIGKADDPLERFRQHCATKDKCHRGNWIRALKKLGQKPILEIVDEIPYKFRDQLECAYIQFFREQGCDLVNGTPGGEGTGSGEDHPNFGTHPKFTPEHCAKLSAASKGRKKSPSHCIAISAAQTGKKLTPEHCTNMSVANAGKKLTPEHRAKLSAAHTGKKLTPEHCANISVAKMGQKLSPEHCAAISAGMTGKARPV